MLYLQLPAILNQRGVNDHLSFLVKSGFTYHTAHRLLHNSNNSISFKHMEKLCVLLNCSITDLFVWKQDKGDISNAGHPLAGLVQLEGSAFIAEHLLQLPLAKVGQVRKMIEEIKNG
ncbi:MAG: helix-turn-helix transcriptional regulator [Sphingobacteriales bacterium]|nr:helix-turn-helix transcriptional regulator [Sphingobacteriales bacterium]